MDFKAGDRVEWSKPGEAPFSRRGGLIDRHPGWAGSWYVRCVLSDLSGSYDSVVHENYIRRAVS